MIKLKLSDNEEIDKFLKSSLISRNEDHNTGISYNILKVDGVNYFVVDCVPPFCKERTLVNLSQYEGCLSEELMALAEKINFKTEIKNEIKNFIEAEELKEKSSTSWDKLVNNHKITGNTRAYRGIPLFVMENKNTPPAKDYSIEGQSGIFILKKVSRKDNLSENYKLSNIYDDESKLNAMYMLYGKLDKIANHVNEFSKDVKNKKISGNKANSKRSQPAAMETTKQYIEECLESRDLNKIKNLLKYAEVDFIEDKLIDSPYAAQSHDYDYVYFLKSGGKISPQEKIKHEGDRILVLNSVFNKSFGVATPWEYKAGFLDNGCPPEKGENSREMYSYIKESIDAAFKNKTGAYKVTVPFATEVCGEWNLTDIDFKHSKKTINLITKDKITAEKIKAFYPKGLVNIKNIKENEIEN